MITNSVDLFLSGKSCTDLVDIDKKKKSAKIMPVQITCVIYIL